MRESLGARPAWYADPWQLAPLRWWDGTAWTEHLLVPSPAPTPPEPSPTFALPGGLWGIAGIAVSVVTSFTVLTRLVDHFRWSPAVFIAVFYLPLYGGIAFTCVAASRRYGTGSLKADFGWRARPTDVWRGMLVWLVAVITGAIATAPWVHDQTFRNTGRAIRHGYHQLGPVAVVEFAVVAIVVAPLLEELAFRGLLQRALSERLPVAWAVVIQAVLFGAYHFTPGLGRSNVPGIVGRAAVGAVLGAAAARWKRLGPGTVAHMMFNVAFVISVVAAH